MRVGMVCYATEQGLGYLAKSFYDNGVVDEVIIVKYPGKTNHTEWYNPPAVLCGRNSIRGPEVDLFLRRVDVVLFFETVFDWSLLKLCKNRAVKTVMMPMYEWFPKRFMNHFDKIFAPSLLDQDYFPGSVFTPVPVETKYWEQRTTATHFLHNGGNLGCHEHKGTRQLLQAIPLLKSDAIVTVRAQAESALQRMVYDTFGTHVPENVRIQSGSVSYENLWKGFDVLVAPEKYNGLSLPLQEARAAGMLVMTTDRYPMNTWLPKGPLIPVQRTHRTVVSGGYLEFDECIISPQDIAQTIDDWYGKPISKYSLSGKYWAEEMSWNSLKQIYVDELEKVCRS